MTVVRGVVEMEILGRIRKVVIGNKVVNGVGNGGLVMDVKSLSTLVQKVVSPS